jgi:hypothetical protein
MHEAIHFDREAKRGAVEIEDVTPRGVLTAKLETPRTSAEGAPQLQLGG